MRRLLAAPDSERSITVELDGEPVPAREGEPLACALLLAGERIFARSVKYHRPRGPFCFEGSCSQCLMRVDGVPNVFTCRTPAKAGMRIERQNAYPTAKMDVFASIDWLFPHGMDHHEMFAGVPVAQTVMAKVARHLAGLGLLPDAPAREPPLAEEIRARVAIVGGGSSGLSAARALADAEVPFVLCEKEDVLGGRRIASAEAFDSAPPSLDRSADARVETRATAIGLYEDEHGRFLAAISEAGGTPRLLLIRADKFLLAMGGHAQMLPFTGCDLPGVYAGAAASALLQRRGVLLGERPAIVGWGDSLHPLAEQLTKAGAKIACVLEAVPESEMASGGKKRGRRITAGSPEALALRGQVTSAHGRNGVSALSVLTADGNALRFGCDSVLVSTPPSPRFELARQGGARVSFEPTFGCFVVDADEDGRTASPQVFVAGGTRRPMSLEEADRHGRKVAEAIAQELAR